MRTIVPLLFAATLAVTGCVETPECPDDSEEIACECGDGTHGELQCEDGVADCVCDSDEESDGA